MQNCPICAAPYDEFSDRCKTPNCGWQFISLLSDSPAERAAYEEKVKQAKEVFQVQQFNQTPDLIRDPFETNEEFAERLSKRSWFAGSATLIKSGYDINTGKFPLELHYEPWVLPLSHADVSHVIAPRDLARSIYEKGEKHPIQVFLTANIAGEVLVDRIMLVTGIDSFDVIFTNENVIFTNEAMSIPVIWLSKVRLGKELGIVCEGAVHEVKNEPEIVVKLYNAETLRNHGREYEIKIEHMLHHAPSLPSHAPRIVQLCWPTAIVRDSSSNFVGFAMPRLDFGRTEKLESFIQPKLAQQKNLRTDLGARITVAANLSGVVSAIHEMGHRIVDLKPINLQLYRQELYVAVLSCDNFEINFPGHSFSALWVTPEYLAPEFQDKPVSNPEQQDRFALAVIIFKLLNFGIHPYTGIAKDRNAPTDLEGNIAKGLYAYAIKPHLKIDPMRMSGHQCLPDEIRMLFDRAFGARFDQRPTAREWFDVLQRYALNSNTLLEPCHERHLKFSGQPCGECHRNAVLGGSR